ncbi:hypothetical protein RM543_03885 [Roseicyclus sp. F158]|uniref:ATP-grasp domain-containing protein n=1 Tax=Tropicimonas omnivorans TaxID=3075590 RepID=A0ABU3DDL6_9RHOB|nr:hypothetical protein [Roseicyclus sp. F158]MDT0681815.1 hypothetical protein [Roseicyclus sp. F158]
MLYEVPDAERLSQSRVLVTLLSEAGARCGGHLEIERTFGHLARFVRADGQARPIFGASLGVNSDAAAAIAADKGWTAEVLRAAGLPAAEGITVFAETFRDRLALRIGAAGAGLPGLPEAVTFAAGAPVAIKPNNGSEGRGVSLATGPAQIERDLAALLSREDRARVERLLPGTDHRLFVLDGRVRAAYRRAPPFIEGDGVRSADALITEALEKIAVGKRGAVLSGDDPRIARSLAAAGMSRKDVVEDGRRVPILFGANLSTGGSLVDLTGRLAPGAEEIAVRAADALGLAAAGVDVMAGDLSETAADAAILEVNSAPGLDNYAGSSAEARERSVGILADMLGRL